MGAVSVIASFVMGRATTSPLIGSSRAPPRHRSIARCGRFRASSCSSSY